MNQPRQKDSEKKDLTTDGRAGCAPVARLFGLGFCFEQASLRFAVGVEEEAIVGDGLLDQLFKEKKLGVIDDGVHAMLEGLHGGESLERIPEQDNGSVTALAHGHALQGLKGEVFGDVVRCEKFLNDYNLVADLAEADEKVTMGSRGVDFVTQFGEGSARTFKQFRGGKCQERSEERSVGE